MNMWRKYEIYIYFKVNGIYFKERKYRWLVVWLFLTFNSRDFYFFLVDKMLFFSFFFSFWAIQNTCSLHASTEDFNQT